MSSKLEDSMQGMSSKLEDGMLAVSAEVVTVSAEVRLFNVGVAAANEELIRTLRERDAKINGQTYIIKKLNADNTKLHADNAKIHEDLERTTTQIGNVFAQNAKLRGEVREVKVALHEMRTNAEESADQHMVALLELKAAFQETKGLLINLVAGPGIYTSTLLHCSQPSSALELRICFRV
jgi:chromosome segregation ATPase